MEAVINDFISRELVQDRALLPLGNATSLLDTGVLDSLNLLRLVVFIQERFGIVVDDVDLSRCVTAMDGAIRASPAEWDFWFEPDDLVSS